MRGASSPLAGHGSAIGLDRDGRDGPGRAPTGGSSTASVAARRLGRPPGSRVPPPVFAGLTTGRSRRTGTLWIGRLPPSSPNSARSRPCPRPWRSIPTPGACGGLYRTVAGSRPGDPDHDLYRLLRLAFYEISQPFLPNTLVDIGSAARRKDEAVAAYSSQQSVRDYAGALQGLNAYRRLTLSGSGPVEAFCFLPASEAFTRSLEEFRRTSRAGPRSRRQPRSGSRFGRRSHAQRPALLAEAAREPPRPDRAPTRVRHRQRRRRRRSARLRAFPRRFEITLRSYRAAGRSAAAIGFVERPAPHPHPPPRPPPRGLVAFLDDANLAYPRPLFDRLMTAARSGRSRSSTPTRHRPLSSRRRRLEAGARTLQYSLDFDRD